MTLSPKLTRSDEDRKPRTRAELLRERAAAMTIVARIDVALADLEERNDGDEFTSASLPPHTSRRAFAEWCRSGRVAGATKVAGIWSCSQRAWRAAHAPKISPPERPIALVTAPARPPADDEAVARAALASADLRATKQPPKQQPSNRQARASHDDHPTRRCG